MGGALLTDLYELNMAASYFRRDMAGEAVFSLFVRDLPPTRGFLVAAGLDDVLSFLEDFAFIDDDLAYLATIGFHAESLEAFRQLRFTGDVWAVPEGRVVVANEPLLEVSAPIAEAQLVETFVLNQVTMQSTLATNAARCRLAGRDRIGMLDFSFRRAPGTDAAMAMARACAMVGFAGTSNVEGARRYGVTPGGTMAHSYVQAFQSEEAAFGAFAEDRPDQATFLVDTYDTKAGLEAAIEVIHRLGLDDRASIRLDSGDLEALARWSRRRLDEAGLRGVRIFASGGLDEYAIEHLVTTGTPVDAVGIGTRMVASAEAPTLDSVYKLVSYDGRPVAKLSAEKATLPGPKQVFRDSPTDGDILALRDEEPGPGAEPLLQPVMKGGSRLAGPDSLAAAKTRFEADLGWLPAGARDLHRPEPVPLRLSELLARLDLEFRHDHGHRAGDS
jgi:nicotinate phosphoribosyltransferase